MADEKNISTYTAYDIEKYHKGLLSPGEMNKLERAALEDPFLADAIDGYMETPVNLSADLADLTNRLQQKKEEKKVIPITGKAGSNTIWWRIAAMLVLVAGISYFGYRFVFNNTKEELALENTNQKTNTAPLAPQAVASDSNATISDNTTNTTVTTEQPSIAEDKLEVKKDIAAYKEKISAEESITATTTDDVFTKQDSTGALNEVVVVGYGAQKKKSLDGKVAGVETKSMNSAPVQRVATKQEADEVLALRNRSQDMVRRAVGGPNTQNRANIYRGQIVDAQQNPIPFANITNPVDNVGTYSDAKGRFSLISPDSVLQVQVRSLGYKEKNIALQTSAATSQVVLQDDQSISPIVLNQKRQNSNMPSRQNNLVFDEPEPEAGWVNYDSYLVNNIRLPDSDYLKNKKQTSEAVGLVQLSFEVSKQGRPINIKVEKSLCDACDKEAIRLLKEGPKWKRNKGKKHSTTIKVSF